MEKGFTAATFLKPMLGLVAALISLTSCVTPPQSGRSQFSSFSSVNNLESFRTLCSEYGFQRGTQAHAECVQKLDKEGRAGAEKQQQAVCSSLQKEMSYWCSDEPSKRGMGSLGAFNCGQKKAEIDQKCH